MNQQCALDNGSLNHYVQPCLPGASVRVEIKCFATIGYGLSMSLRAFNCLKAFKTQQSKKTLNSDHVQPLSGLRVCMQVP